MPAKVAARIPRKRCRPTGLVLREDGAKVRSLASALQTATCGKARRADGGVFCERRAQRFRGDHGRRLRRVAAAVNR